MESTSLKTWMHLVLRLAGCFNICAGFFMMVLYHEGFKSLGLTTPDLNLPIQLVGMFVILMGVSYFIVDLNPVENRNLLLIGILSKALGPLIACFYIARGDLPMWMLGVLAIADFAYLIPFWIIYMQLRKLRFFSSVDQTP